MASENTETQEPETTATLDPPDRAPTFDLLGPQDLTFAMLDEGRAAIYHSEQTLRAFRAQVEGLADDGDTGRRKGLAMWMLGRYQECADQLASYPDDVVATYTRAKAILSLERPEEAAPLFQKLSHDYPDHPQPRGSFLEAQLQCDLGSGDSEAALANLSAALEAVPESFTDSAEYHYLRGREAEIERDWERALDEYLIVREMDPNMRQALFRAAYVAERGGLDELAIDLYEQLSKFKPVDRNVLLNLGVLYEDSGRDQDAAACYETVVRSYPTDARARLYLEDAKQAIDMYYDEDQERKEDRLNQILRIPITDFELSVRARNCLNKMNISTLGDLVCRTEQELLSYKNFGETSLNEIKEILHSKGLRLGMPREEAVASVESAARREQASGDKGDVFNRPITELQLSIRARRTVEGLGCLTVGDITKHSPEELLGMPNFGVTSLQELKNKLAELGLKLRGD